MDREHPDSGDYITPPMSLRDYFAGQALAGFQSLSAPIIDANFREETMAIRCYKMADAMLRAREVKP